ncbi:hypothetical protein DZK27_09255 [Rhodobacteraceae bacterium 63075]|nr:hypothetical protein DZK27_09255 [Rhodobacteraceae bacterium 63075]
MMQLVAIDDDGAALDLVAHFLGIASHDNVNAAPSCAAGPEAIFEMTRQEAVSGDHGLRIVDANAR